MLYFSYGSNMSSLRLRARASSARFIDTAILHGHELRFHKKSLDGSAKCDAYETENTDDYVIGVVFEIAVSDKPVLDRYEGLGYGYEEKTVSLQTPANGNVIAHTYYATHIDPSLSPYHWYKHHVVSGAKEHKLPLKYVQGIDMVASITDPEPDRHELEMSIYQATQIPGATGS